MHWVLIFLVIFLLYYLRNIDEFDEPSPRNNRRPVAHRSNALLKMSPEFDIIDM